jgi:peptidoglycan LD-endopeptidase LytH
MYTSDLFAGERNIHMGVDISGPVGTPIYSFADGEILKFAYNGADGDYGYTLLSKHKVDGRDLFVLWGHLQKKSVENKKVGQLIKRGEVIAWIGDKHENGGWNPHLHFQLSYEEPAVCDMPGVVSAEDLPAALLKYPDPRIVLGPIY